MKRLLILLSLLFWVGICYAADTKVSDLEAITEFTTDDLLYIVDGATVSKKITLENFFTNGFTVGANNSITLGSSTMKYENTRADFILSNDVILEDINPGLWLRCTDDNKTFGLHYHMGTAYLFGLWYGTDSGSGVVVGNSGYPIWSVDSSLNFKFPFNNVYVEADLVHEFSRGAMIENLAAADDNMSLGAWTNNVTITKVGCAYVGTGTTPATITLEDGSGNAMTHATCACVASGTNITFVSVTANNTLNAGELLRFDVSNAVSPETDEYTIIVGWTE